MAKALRWDPAALSRPAPRRTTTHSQRKAPCRAFRPHDARVWLGRWEADQLVAEACRLRRISARGAVVLLERPLPDGKTAWLRLHRQSHHLGSVPVRVTKSVDVAPGATLVWLRFGVPCPDELLYTAVLGPDALETSLN